MITPDVNVSDRTIEGPAGPLLIRIYAPGGHASVGLVWAHGGGFIWGDLDIPEADWVARNVAAHGIVVVSVDYHLVDAENAAGGVRAPLPALEVAAAYQWARASDFTTGAWSIGGASAGGNLTAGATLHLLQASAALPERVLLIYPTLHADQPPISPDIRAKISAMPEEDIFAEARVREMYNRYHAGATSTVVTVPGTACGELLAGFPSTLIVNSDADPLRASGEAFAESLLRAGSSVQCVTEPGSQHGHLNRPQEEAAWRSVERMAAFLLG